MVKRQSILDAEEKARVVKELHESGLNYHEIIERSGYTDSSVRRAAKRAEIELRHTSNMARTPRGRAKNLATVKNLHESGYDFWEIMQEVGVKRPTMEAYFKELGYEFKSLDNPRREFEEKKEMVIRLTNLRQTAAQIAQQLGISPRQVTRYRSKGRKVAYEQRSVDEETRKRIALMIEDQVPPREICRTFQLHQNWVHRNYPGYKYSETKDAAPNYGLWFVALEKLPDRLEKAR